LSLYDADRDPVRIAGRRLRWAARWIALPLLAGLFLSANVDVRVLPLVGAERETAVLLLDGQAYFGHLDDSGESGTLLLRDVYYFQSAAGGPTGLAVGLVRRGTEAHEPADGMRINRDKVLAVEPVGPNSAVAQAIGAQRRIAQASPALLSLNRAGVAPPQIVLTQRAAAERALQRGFVTAADQLAKLNELVLPVSRTEAKLITDKALADLRTVRRNALAAIAAALGMAAAEAQTYVTATDQLLEGQTFANEVSVLLAPDLNGIVNSASRLYGQVGDSYAKQLTASRTALPSPSPAAPSPSPSPSVSPSPTPTPRP
jgi:hypothetical protein